MVTSADKLRYDAMFKQADKDADGLVSGTKYYFILISSKDYHSSFEGREISENLW